MGFPVLLLAHVNDFYYMSLLTFTLFFFGMCPHLACDTTANILNLWMYYYFYFGCLLFSNIYDFFLPWEIVFFFGFSQEMMTLNIISFLWNKYYRENNHLMLYAWLITRQGYYFVFFGWRRKIANFALHYNNSSLNNGDL